MKKIIVLLCTLFIGSNVLAEDVYWLSGVDMNNFWEKNGKMQEKVLGVGHKIIYANQLKRAPIMVELSPKMVNAFAQHFGKQVTISSGILPYIDNDDELAFVISHELAHSMEFYDGAMKTWAMAFNSKKYEYKADLNGLDYMIKAGYDPISGIIVANKIFPEPVNDRLLSHPSGSKRMLEMYKYIYVKYPKYLNSPMTKNIVYINFLRAEDREIKKFEQKQKKRQLDYSEVL